MIESDPPRRAPAGRQAGSQALERFVDDPVGFVATHLGEHLWSRQREIALAVRDHRRVAVPSCHDAGKSFLAARLAAWWIACRPAGTAFVVTSAPTFAQVRAILWREIAVAHAKGGLPGRLNRTEWWRDGKLVGFGRKPGDHDPTGFQGIHARHVMVVFDEACGIPQPLWDAADTLIANAHGRMFAIGNPDDPTGAFARVCLPGSGWRVLRIDAFETPNLSGEVIPEGLADLLVSPTWVDEKRIAWGEESPLWLAKVRGLFPEAGGDGVVAPAAVRAAHERELSDGAPARLGVDVARFGRDRTVLALRRGDRVRIAATLEGTDLMRTTGEVAALLRAEAGIVAVVDEIGLGAGVVDRLAEQGLAVRGVNVARAARNRDRFVDLRAELFWGLRDRFLAGEIDLDPADDELARQLVALTWGVDSRGRIRVESKERMRRRGLPSPDRADAVALAFAPEPPEPTGFFHIGG